LDLIIFPTFFSRDVQIPKLFLSHIPVLLVKTIFYSTAGKLSMFKYNLFSRKDV